MLYPFIFFCFLRSDDEGRRPVKVMRPKKAMKAMKAMKVMKAMKKAGKKLFKVYSRLVLIVLNRFIYYT